MRCHFVLRIVLALPLVGVFPESARTQSFYLVSSTDGVVSLLRQDVDNLDDVITVATLSGTSSARILAVDSWHRHFYVASRGPHMIMTFSFDGTNLDHQIGIPGMNITNTVSGLAFDPAAAELYIQLIGQEKGSSCCLYWSGDDLWRWNTRTNSRQLLLTGTAGWWGFPSELTFAPPDDVFYHVYSIARVQRYNLVTEELTDLQNVPVTISFNVDPVDRKIYFVRKFFNGLDDEYILVRSNFDGTNPEVAIEDSPVLLRYLAAIDVNRGKLYGSSYERLPNGQLEWEYYVFDLDSNELQIMPRHLASTWGAFHACDRGDCDGDGLNTMDDARSGLLPCLFGPGVRSGGDCCCADANGDGQVDLRDVAAFQRLDPMEVGYELIP